MTPDPRLQALIDELANALQTATLLAGALATDLRADAGDADRLHEAIARATAALRRIQPNGGAR